MELKGQQTLSLPVAAVWNALNDPAILQQCIPSCDTFELTQENQYKIAMTATVGPIKARFTGKLVLSDITPPSSYTLQFDGSGGAAGSGKGTANVHLSESPEGTVLHYTVGATVSGRLAQVGARLIDGVAKKMADQFFARFKAILEPADEPGTSEPDARIARPAETPTNASDAQAGAKTSGNAHAPANAAPSRSPGARWAAAIIILAIALGLYAFST